MSYYKQGIMFKMLIKGKLYSGVLLDFDATIECLYKIQRLPQNVRKDFELKFKELDIITKL